jgi:diguanylate cyclase
MRMFGFATRPKEIQAEARRLPVAECMAGHGARQDLLEQISTFLLVNALPVTPQNLTLVHSIMSGTNLQLSRKVLQRQLADQPITQAWLDELTAEARESGAELNQLVARLERSLNHFSATAGEAGSTASVYGIALQKTVQSIESAESGQLDVTALAELTRTMIEHTRHVEAEMRRSENDASALRKSLESARRDADVDHLTGLPNRRAFEAVLEREYRAAREAIDPLSIAFCDIDLFKRINDTHGHDTGDRVIQAIADVLQRISGENCHVARHGGEEFVLLFRGLSPDEAREKLDHARENFAQRKLVNRETDAPIGSVTFSGGVADVFAYSDPRAALKAADEALYQAKEAGRNRILVAGREAG